MPSTGLGGHLAHHVEGPGLNGFGVQRVERVADGLHPQELKKVDSLGRIDADRLQRAAHLVGDGFGRIAVVETASTAEELEERQVRDVAAVGDAVRLEPGHVPAAEPLAKLVEEARLPDARLARDAHDLPVAHHRRGQPALQEIQLLAAAHEACHTAARAEAGALGTEQPVARRTPRGERGEREAPLQEGRRGGRHHDLRTSPGASGPGGQSRRERASRGARSGTTRPSPAGRR